MKRIGTLLFLILSINCFAQTPVVVDLTQKGQTRLTIAQGGTNAIAPAAARDSLGIIDPTIQAYQAAGSQVKAQLIGSDISKITGKLAFATSSSDVIFVPVYLPTHQTITGATLFCVDKGTQIVGAGKKNKLALYSYSGTGTTINLVDSTVSDSTIFNGPSSNTWIKKAFVTTYNAAPGLYFVAALLNSTAASTFTMGMVSNVINVNVYSFDFTSGISFGEPFTTGNADLPTSVNLSTATKEVQVPYMAIY